MRISDWSSDVCSSDLAQAPPDPRAQFGGGGAGEGDRQQVRQRHAAPQQQAQDPRGQGEGLAGAGTGPAQAPAPQRQAQGEAVGPELGSPSTRARACQYVDTTATAPSSKHKTTTQH